MTVCRRYTRGGIGVGWACGGMCRGRERRGAGHGIPRRGVTRRSAWGGEGRQPGIEDYMWNILSTLCAFAAKSRNAALMLETCSSLSRLIAKLRRQASVRGVLPVRARQRSSS